MVVFDGIQCTSAPLSSIGSLWMLFLSPLFPPNHHKVIAHDLLLVHSFYLFSLSSYGSSDVYCKDPLNAFLLFFKSELVLTPPLILKDVFAWHNVVVILHVTGSVMNVCLTKL